MTAGIFYFHTICIVSSKIATIRIDFSKLLSLCVWTTVDQFLEISASFSPVDKTCYITYFIFPPLQMHIEAAKMMQFSEEEFVKALEWGS